MASKLRHGPVEVIPVNKGKNAWLFREGWKRSWKPWRRGTFIGFPIGTVPAGGPDVSTFLSYAAERKLAKGKDKAQCGKDAIEDVAGPKAANNAAAAGVLVPLLTLRIPTTATAAMMLTAFQRYQIQPGPLLFENQGALVWTLIASLDVGNLMLLVLNLPLVGPVGEDPADPAPLPVRRHPVQLRRSPQLSRNDPLTLFSSPFAVAAYVSMALIFVVSWWLRRRQARWRPCPRRRRFPTRPGQRPGRPRHRGLHIARQLGAGRLTRTRTSRHGRR